MADKESTKESLPNAADNGEHHPLVIIGGGIGGLVLALCLDQVYNHPTTTNHNNNSNTNVLSSSKNKEKLQIHIYESTSAYTANAGGAIGLYSNGLRVLRHLSKTHPKIPDILYNVRSAGCDYLYRRWMRHDGFEVAVAREDELLPDVMKQVVVDDDAGNNDDDGNDNEGGNENNESYQRQRSRSRGNSITSQDKEGERANRRPRGGSFGGLKDAFQQLGLRNLASTTPSSTNSAADLEVATATSNTPRTPRHSSVRTVERELLSLGIRRWKYQQVLYDACVAAGVVIHFGKRLQSVTSIPPNTNEEGGDGDAKTLLHFKDGTTITTSLLIGADGINSKVRNYVTNPNNLPKEEYVPEYTGVTCLMGCANVPRIRGICFPSSATTKCHACYYPTRAPREIIATNGSNDSDNDDEEGTTTQPDHQLDYEQVFQIYFPSPIERPDTWRTLTPQEAKTECRELAIKLREDGWDEQFLKPLESETLTGVLRVGLRSREGLDCWFVGGDSGVSSNVESVGADDEKIGANEKTEEEEEEDDRVDRAMLGRAVLLGDAAHPPVPYIGQGAMMAMEDAGTLSMILAHYCPIISTNSKNKDYLPTPDFTQFTKAMATYESLRVSRTKAILGSSVQLGKTQQKRAESKLYNAWRELSIKAQVWAYGTLPVMRPGAAFDYKVMVEEALAAEREDEKKEKE